MRKPRRTLAAMLTTACVAATSLVVASNHASAISALKVTTTELPSTKTIERVSDQLTASGGVKPYTWSLTEGAMSEGLMLSPRGVIGGHPHTAGTFHFTVQVRDALLGTATRALTMVVDPACPTGTFPSELYGLADIQPRHSKIDYLWVEDNGVVHLRGTHGQPRPMRFSGTVTTTGRFGSVWSRGRRNPPAGTVQIKVNAARTKVTYVNRNVGGTDGINFTVRCAGTLTFDLYADGKRLDTKQIALGTVNATHAPSHPWTNPFSFTIPVSAA